MPPDWSRDRFAAAFSVPRETLERLAEYEAALLRWNRAINLVGPATLQGIWGRHFADSAQLWRLRPLKSGVWTDIGSGGGLPGLVVAILARETDLCVHLIESDRRKCAFLQAVKRKLGLTVMIHPARMEVAKAPPAAVLSARALAPLVDLIGIAQRLRDPAGTCLFPKGREHQKELDAARALWDFEYELHPSVTDPAAAIIEIGAIHGRR